MLSASQSQAGVFDDPKVPSAPADTLMDQYQGINEAVRVLKPIG
jgi:hypothetical protein